MKKIIKTILLSLVFTSILVPPSLVLAQSSNNSAAPAPSNHLIQTLTNIANKGGYQTDPTIASIPKFVGLILRAFLGFLGIVFLILMILAGYNWMTAEGNEEQTKKAKRTIKQALIGLVVAISAWTIWAFVFERLILMNK